MYIYKLIRVQLFSTPSRSMNSAQNVAKIFKKYHERTMFSIVLGAGDATATNAVPN